MNIDNIPQPGSNGVPLPAPVLDPLSGALRRRAERPDDEEPHKSPANLLRVAVIGYGYWGPNIVRNSRVSKAVSRLGSTRARRFSIARAGSIRRSDDDGFSKILTHLRSTPSPSSHRSGRISRWRNRAGKQQARLSKATHVDHRAGRRAHRAGGPENLRLMVDHTFLSGPVTKIRQLVDKASWEA